MNFLNKDTLVVLTNELVLHFWSMDKLEIIAKHQIITKEADIKSVYVLPNTIIVEDKSFVFEFINCSDLKKISGYVKHFEGENVIFFNEQHNINHKIESYIVKYDNNLSKIVIDTLKL